MTSKTPQFDKALDEYFEKLELDEKGGQWRTCRFSGEKFYIRPEDIEFYKKIRVPLPTLSPRERIRRKLAFYNSHNLFYVKSALTGKDILSNYLPSTSHKIYEHHSWFGGEWEPMEYARDYDFGKKFFDQFREHALNVPRPSLIVDSSSVNSEYTNDAFNLKNCYLVFFSMESEDSSYSIDLRHSRGCLDCFTLINSQECYDSFVGHNLYRCFFTEFSRDCMDSYFLFDCRNCKDCFGGTNLRNKKYVFFNEQLTKDDYEKKLLGINLGNRDILNSYKNKFEELKKSAIYKPDHNERSINSYGDFIVRSKDIFASYFMYDSENTTYSIGGLGVRDSYDTISVETEFSYESGSSRAYHVLFCCEVWDSRDLEYCNLCINCHDCFGSIGLVNKSFCIFNKQYSEENYWRTIDEIKAEMLKDKEYGEFFSPDISFFPYNASLATSYKGYDDIENARKYGYTFQEVPEYFGSSSGDVVKVEDLPKNIKDVQDDILDKIIVDSNNKKFKYIKPEIDFYRKNNLPLSQKHFSERLREKRMKLGSIAIEFFARICPKCGIKFETVYPPEDERIVYCKPCYLKEIV